MNKNLRVLFTLVLTFIILASSVFAIYIPVKGNSDDYNDIKNHWAYDSMCYVIKNGYFKGVTSNEFRPEVDMSRAMLVTVLWRLTGEDLTTTRTVDGVTKIFPKYVNMFWDMDDDAWYTNYVSWANENKIISGYSKREFRPDESITREQLAVVLYNYLKEYKKIRGFESIKVNEKVDFSDNELIAEWARDKVSIMQQIGLMSGRNDGRFDPKATVTRAEISVIIQRLVEKI